jgi:hypothetical protein
MESSAADRKTRRRKEREWHDLQTGRQVLVRICLGRSKSSRKRKTGNPKVARQIESARKTELAKGEVGIKDKTAAPTFSAFSERFLDWMTAERGEKKNTIRFYRDRVRQLLLFDKFKSVLVDQIDEEMIAAHKEGSRIGRYVEPCERSLCQS